VTTYPAGTQTPHQLPDVRSCDIAGLGDVTTLDPDCTPLAPQIAPDHVGRTETLPDVWANPRRTPAAAGTKHRSRGEGMSL
jgi:hypothetical protein